MPRNEARHSRAFARQLDKVFARPASGRKKFTRTPSRQLHRAKCGGATADELRQRQRQRRATLDALTPEQRHERAEQRDAQGWEQHEAGVEVKRQKDERDAAHEKLRLRALAKKGDARRILAASNLDKLDQWEEQEAADNALSNDDKTEQVTALIDAAMNGDFAMVKGKDALDYQYYRYWLEGVSPKVADLWTRALVKGNTKALKERGLVDLQQRTQAGYKPVWSAANATLRSRATPEQVAKTAAAVAQSRQDIEDGVATEDDIRRVYWDDHKDEAHDVGNDLADITNLFIDNDVFRAIKDNLHKAVSDEVANNVMDAVTVASAVDPTGATELVAGTWQALQGIDAALQFIPEHVETNQDREKAQREELLANQDETRRGNVRNLVTGGRVRMGSAAGRSRARSCALVSRARHH